MVLEHQGMLQNLQTPGLQPALQLYAAATAHLAPRNRVPQWPFLQFGIPGMFGGQFLTRPRFGPPGPHGLAALSGLNNINNNTHQSISPHRAMPGPPSEDSNDERGKCQLRGKCWQLDIR